MHSSKEIKGIRIRSFNIFTIILSTVLYAILIYETVNISLSYQALINTTQDYISCENDAALLNEASDYLTEQVRLFVINQESGYMNAYFEELNETKRRDQALEDLQQRHSTDDIYTALQNAMDCSNELTVTEFYAMKLVCTAIHYEKEDLPEELLSLALDEEDTVLSTSAMLDKARSLVFDASYEEVKDRIEGYVAQVTDPILTSTRHDQTDSMKSLENAIARDRICLSVLLITNLIMFSAIAMLVVKPLHTYIKCLNHKTLLEASGAYELRYLALTYNRIYNKNAANEAILRQKAERDALTGILNRGAFNQIITLLEDSTDPIALLLIDVDQFKSINDGYGHNTGDQILKNVASTLTRSFRSSDHIARIGGDEFAVIMTNTTAEQIPVIQRKAGEMNDALSHPEDDLPSISLSIGAAFSTHGYKKELFEHADQALYHVKENGRCGCAVFEEM